MGAMQDYMAPRPKEIEQRKTAQLLVFALEQLGKDIPEDVQKVANNSYGGDVNQTERLYKLLSELSEDQREQLVYDAHNRTSRHLADWWEDQSEKIAREREVAEAEARRQEVRAQALEKLTPEEREALGEDQD